jgi:hypothetical protein
MTEEEGWDDWKGMVGVAGEGEMTGGGRGEMTGGGRGEMTEGLESFKAVYVLAENRNLPDYEKIA